MYPTSEEAWWEQEHERTAPAPTLASQHSDWHVVHGWLNGCPLDCAASDLGYELTPVESFYVELFSPDYCSGDGVPFGDEPDACPCHHIDAPF